MSSAVASREWISPEDYLAMEERAEVKHEYAGGHVYAMSGAINRHNIIAANILVAVANQLRGKPCRPFNSDTKVRIRIGNDLHFYYPDVMVVCRQNPEGDVFQDEPAVIFEVLSPSSHRTDFDGKRWAYCSLSSLAAYVVVDAEEVGLTVFRRGDDTWNTEVVRNPAATLDLPTIGCTLPVAQIYEGTTLVAIR